jgi:hypothetical protein
MLAVFLRNMQGRWNVWQFILNHKDDPHHPPHFLAAAKQRA